MTERQKRIQAQKAREARKENLKAFWLFSAGLCVCYILLVIFMVAGGCYFKNEGQLQTAMIGALFSTLMALVIR